MTSQEVESPLTIRQRNILDELDRRGFISTTDLAQALSVSDMTVRRDTNLLAKRGLVRVVHGGVSLVAGGHNADFAARAREDSDAKQRVALACLPLIGPRDAIILDAGTTAFEIVRQLPASFSGTLITHSAPTIQRCLQLTSARTICLGGELLIDSQAFIGPMTITAAEGIRAHTAFIGVSGIHDDAFYIDRDFERSTKLALMNAAERVVVVATNGKMKRSALSRLVPFSEVDMLVTDQAPPADIARGLKAADVEVVTAD